MCGPEVQKTNDFSAAAKLAENKLSEEMEGQCVAIMNRDNEAVEIKRQSCRNDASAAGTRV